MGGVTSAVRKQVREAVEDGIVRLLLERERDPDRALLSRVLAPRGSATAHDIAAAPATRDATRPPSAGTG